MKRFLVVLAIFFLSLSLRLLTLNQMGRTWDEQAIVERGYIDLQLAKQGNFSDPYWYEYADHPPLVNYLYGMGSLLDFQSYDYHQISKFYPSNKGVPIFRYDLTYSRLVSVLFSSLSVVLVVLFGWRYISPFVGVAAGILLSMLPVNLGLSQQVTYETFITFFFTAGVFTFVEFLKSEKLKFLALAGIISGLALEVKQTNILLVLLATMLYATWVFIHKKRLSRRMFFMHTAIFSVSFLLTCFLIWPMAWFHIGEVIAYTHKGWFSFSQSNIELYFGKVHHVPIVYFLVNLLVTIPAGVLLFFFLGIKKVYKEKSWTFWAVFLWFALPFVQSFYPFRQNGIRYIIEIYPPFCLLAGIGLGAIKNIRIKFLATTALFVYLLFVLMRISPYYLDYFNELIGGPKFVYDHKVFDLNWWGAGQKEAAMYIKSHAPKGTTIGMALDPMHTMETFPGWTFVPYEKNKIYDYVIINYLATIRGGYDERPIQKNYHLVYTVYADGAQLVHVYKVN